MAIPIVSSHHIPVKQCLYHPEPPSYQYHQRLFTLSPISPSAFVAHLFVSWDSWKPLLYCTLGCTTIPAVIWKPRL